MGVPQTDPKVAGHHFSLQIIAEIDLYKFDPWVLPSKAIFGEKECSSRLDDWVLCRIYKKNSSAQKVVPSLSSKEYSNGSSSSSSSHLDDMLESLPEIDDRCFALPRVNSLKTFQHDEKLNFQNSGTGNYVDWTTPVVLNSVADIASGNQSQSQTQGMMSYNTGTGSDLYVPSMPSLMEEEVQSGVKSQRVDNSGFYQQNSNVFTQGLSNSIDPYGFRYPSEQIGYGFRQ
ncbi:hypothetical protein L6164_018480 [Bauhinia variegata]|uniref:Uncharacterized protein n=1 Tax=Bauhinia variegata TaxID=167791 RepID=A0ACB9NCQ5_BAUVA|nr:hypothetical protein L6164_018480 [Bauhinia variegata]